MTDDLRERVYARIRQARDDAYMDCRGMVPFRAAMMAAVDDLIALFAEREREAATRGYAVGAKHAAARCAERERLLRARIEALPTRWESRLKDYPVSRKAVLAEFDEAVPEVANKPVCASCGDLSWTVSRYGRVTHKEACRFRTDPWSQSYPRRGDDGEAVRDGE